MSLASQEADLRVRSSLFSRTRDADLHEVVRDERFVLAAEHKQRSLRWVLAYAALPHVYLALVVAIGLSGLPWWQQLCAAFLPVLLAQRAFLVLVHEASHKFYSASRTRNDLLGDFLAAGFIGMLVRKYRNVHLAHHSANGSADDPEFFGYEAVRAVGGLSPFVLRYALGLELPRLLGKYYSKQQAFVRHSPQPARDERRALESLSIGVCQLVLIALLAGLASAPHLYLLWLYVAVTWSPLLSRLRFLAEHPGKGELTLTTRAGLWECMFFAPLSFHHHFEHHLFPAVPPYRLADVHRELARTGFFERHPEHLGRSFVSTLKSYEGT